MSYFGSGSVFGVEVPFIPPPPVAPPGLDSPREHVNEIALVDLAVRRRERWRPRGDRTAPRVGAALLRPGRNRLLPVRGTFPAGSLSTGGRPDRPQTNRPFTPSVSARPPPPTVTTPRPPPPAPLASPGTGLGAESPASSGP